MRSPAPFPALAAALLVAGGAFSATVKTLDREVFVRDANYDESKIAPYTLEDPLRFVDGRAVTKENWPERRREILGIFAREMYGAEPPPPAAVVTELVDEKVTAVLDDMIERSITEYPVMRSLVEKIGAHYARMGKTIVDIGCSNGNAIAPFVSRFAEDLR